MASVTFAREVTHAMIRIGIVREGKIPPDNRTPFSPKQCKEIQDLFPQAEVLVQPSLIRCFSDEEYRQQGICVQEDLQRCDILFGVKEQRIETLLPGKTYLFFSHTKKKQAHNQALMKALLANRIRMIDYECLTHNDGHRVIGFGYWAGIVGAHNGLLTYGRKTGLFDFKPVHTYRNFLELKESYESFTPPPVKIVVTGSGRVSTGVLDILNYLQIAEVSPDDFLHKEFPYAVFTHLKGADLYARVDGQPYQRADFHDHPEAYRCCFLPYTRSAHILMNGIYWDKKIPRLFECADMNHADFRLSVIADITCDEHGSVPCNVGATTIADPVYGYDRVQHMRMPPYLPGHETVEIMAVDNLPNELPRDASKYFGGHLLTFILNDLVHGVRSPMLQRATLCENGELTAAYTYLSDYAGLPV